MENIIKRRRRRRRARFVFFVIMLLALAIARAAAFGGDSSAGGCGGEVVYAEVFVNAGDTLWSIASDNAPAGSDLRKYIREIEKINGFSNQPLRANTVIFLPPEKD